MKVGDVFGRLTVLSLSTTRKYYVLVVCQCGNKKEVKKYHLISGAIKSCGCYKIERLNDRTATHSMSNTSEYKSWSAMLYRCKSKKDKRFMDYGGRGISVCNRWNDFELFILDMGMKPFVGAQVDRINNSGNYCKSNCKWSSRKENQRNTRSNVFIQYKGEKILLVEIAERFNLNPSTLRKRLARGWSVERAIETKVKPKLEQKT